MLKRIRFKFGPTPDSEPVQFTPAPMNVLVGPNNAGKSLTLQELHRSLSDAESGWRSNAWKVLADIEPGLPPSGKLREKVLSAINADFALIRVEDPKIYIAMTNTLRKPGMSDDDILVFAHWVAPLSKRGNALELINAGKMRDPTTISIVPPKFPDTVLKDAFRPGAPEFWDWFPANDIPLIELIQAVNERAPEDLVTDGLVDLHGYYRYYSQASLLLDGSARLDLALDERNEGLHVRPKGTVMRLRYYRKNLEKLRAFVHDAFGKHLCVDISDLRSARLLLSDHPPPPNLEDRIDHEALAYLRAARHLKAFSDGVRSYIGLHAELLAHHHRYVMVDEPEAFLHPPLARRLGFNLSNLAAERGSSVFAATHSPDFLMGCIESGVPVNIIRMGYRNGRASAHILPYEKLQEMMYDPLLRSTGILGALFHQAAVVVEGDSDRTFYTEVNERLRLHEPADHPPVMRDCVFLNAQGKATVSRILEALRRLGVASCGIVDLDLLKDAGICTNLLRAAGAPPSVCASIGVTRANVQASITDLKALCKPNGLAHATSDERKGVEHFIREMVSHGIFLPEVGPVEGWLSELGVGADKKGWIPAIFQAMGPVNTGLKPGRGDVWQFLRRIGRYLEDLGGTLDQTSISAPSVASIQD